MVDWSLVISILALGLSLLGYIHNRTALANAKKQWAANRVDALFADARPLADALTNHLDTLAKLMDGCRLPMEWDELTNHDELILREMEPVQMIVAKLDARLGSFKYESAFQPLRHSTFDIRSALMSLANSNSDSADQRASLIAQLTQAHSEWDKSRRKLAKLMQPIQSGDRSALGYERLEELGLPPSQSSDSG